MKRLFLYIKADYARRRLLLESDGLSAYFRNEKGYVLVIVLLVSSLLITVSGEFFANAQTNMSYMSKITAEAQAQELAEIGVRIAAYILEADRTGKTGSISSGRNTNSAIDCYDDLWAADMPPIPVEDGTFSFVIRDEQSKINTSITANEFIEKSSYYYILARFFQLMDFRQDMADSILDWVDTDNTRSGYGAETFDYYSTLANPYRSKNGALDSIEELLMIKNITPEIYYGLGGGNYGKEHNLVDENMNIKPFSLDDTNANEKSSDKTTRPIGPEKSRALPDYLRAYGDNDFSSQLNKININTASYRVISALTADMTADKVTELIRRRMSKPFTSVEETADMIKDETVRKNNLSVSSNIFSITAAGRFHGKSVTVSAIYNRASKKYYYYSIR